MKAEFTKDKYLKITPESVAESIALFHMFIKEQDTKEWIKNIVIDSNLTNTIKE